MLKRVKVRAWLRTVVLEMGRRGRIEKYLGSTTYRIVVCIE